MYEVNIVLSYGKGCTYIDTIDELLAQNIVQSALFSFFLISTAKERNLLSIRIQNKIKILYYLKLNKINILSNSYDFLVVIK